MLRAKAFALLPILGFILTSSAIANTPTNNLIVTVPNLLSGFEFSVAALALKPGASNLNYVIYNKGLPLQSPSWTEKELKPGFDGAFALGLRYIAQEGKDINLDWTHLNSNTSASTAAPDDSYFLGPDYQIGPNAIPFRNATGHVEFNYDVVNLDVGQYVDFGSHTRTRFFIGLSGPDLREKVRAYYTGSVPTGPYQGPFSLQQTVTAQFIGVGPRLGMEVNYFTDSGVGFFGKGGIAALIGSAKTKTDFVSASQQLLITFNQDYNYQTIKDQNVMQVLPGFDTKLGISYKHHFGPCSLLTLEAGYQAAVYVNAINQYLPATLVDSAPIETGGIFVATMSHRQSNYSVQGPFISAALQIN